VAFFFNGAECAKLCAASAAQAIKVFRAHCHEALLGFVLLKDELAILDYAPFHISKW
jgi:hypothetical protein